MFSIRQGEDSNNVLPPGRAEESYSRMPGTLIEAIFQELRT